VQKVIGLSLHGSDTYLSAHVCTVTMRTLTSVTEKDPRESLAPQDLILEPKLVVGIILLDQPDQDTSTLENIMSLSSSGVFDIVIDKRGDSSIRVNLQEFR